MLKRLLISAVILSSLIGIAYAAMTESYDGFIVQGIEYNSTLPNSMQPRKAPAMRSGEILEPGTELVYDGDFTFDMIENWSGTGSKSAALVLQWNTGRDANALVFGFHWDGTATGFDMLKAVVENNPRLFALCQATNVGCDISPIAPGGYTLCGIGWDDSESGNVSITDTKNAQTYTETSGFYIHPRGWDPVTQSGSIDYDYDNWKAADATALWQAGWYQGYWSYWCKDKATSQFGYSGWGISCRELKDGSWDGWNYSANMTSYDWKPFMAAPANMPEGAKTQFVNNGLCYNLKNYTQKTVELVAPFEGITYAGDITIPTAFVDEGITYTVVSVGKEAFAGAEISGVTLPESVKKLGNGAFQGSTIASINLTDNITSIGAECFAGCYMLSSAYIPASLTKIPDYCFMGTAIESLTFTDNIEAIGDGAYSYCAALTDVTLGNNLRTLGAEAFAGCDALATFTSGSTVPPTAQASTFDDGIAATLVVPIGFDNIYRAATGWSKFSNYGFITLPVNVGDQFVTDNIPFRVTAHQGDVHEVKVTYHPTEGVVKPSLGQIKTANQTAYAAVSTIAVPATVNYQGVDFKVTAVSDTAFYYADKVVSISIPDGVKFDKGVRVFNYCSALQSVTLPAGMTKVGDYMFDSCNALASITLPESVTELGANCFSNCKALTSVALHEGITKLGDRSFYNCTNLKDVTLPATITEIPTYAFGYTAIESISLGQNITKVGNSVFANCKSLTSASIANADATLGTYLFQNCEKLTSVDLPANLKAIPNYTFQGCKALTQIDFPAGINSIGTYAFASCIGLETLTLPDAVTAIPTNCFQYCTGLKYVTISPNATSLGNYAFDGCTALESIRVSGEEFDEAEGITRLPATIASIGTYCFRNTKTFNMEFHEGLKTLGQYAFQNAKGITEVILPSTLTTISNYCFSGCSNITNVVIPASVTSFGTYDLFYGCNNAKIYVCNTKPKACGANSWRIASGKYHTLVIPTDSKVTISTLTGWKNATLTEPEVSSVNFGDMTITESKSAVKVEVPFSVNYASAMQAHARENAENQGMPAVFAEFNNGIIASAITAVATDGNSTAYEGSVTYADGKVTASFAGLPANEPLTFTLTSTVEGLEPVVVTASHKVTTIDTGVHVNFDKINNWSLVNPQSAARYAVVFRWNDCVEGNSSYQCPMDNLVYGGRFPAGSTSVKNLITLVGSRNTRLTYNADFSQFAFDMLGDGHETLTAYDHNKANTDTNKWRFWIVASNGETTEATPESTIGNGQTLVVDYQPVTAEEPSYCPDLFYVPAASEIGVFMPETTTFVLRDNCHLFVPYFVNVGQGGSFRVATASEEFSDYVTSAPVVSNQSEGNTTLRAHMNFVTGKTGSFPLTVTATIAGTEYTASTNVKIAAPLRPITSIALDQTEPIVITGYPNRNAATLTYNFEPADASYTKVAWQSTDNLVATVSSGNVSAGGKQGTCEVRAMYAADEAVYGAVEVQQVLNQLVEEIQFGDENGVFNLEYMDILLLAPTMLPENADNKNFNYEIIGDPEIATVYASTKDLVNHKPGTVQVKISTVDGSDLSKTVTVNFNEPDRTPLADGYQDGTFWLNEEWFTHTNGSINYITADGDLKYRVYESQNPYECFGATSCSAVIYGDRIYVSSKQPHDSGDTRPGGGRLVIFDAKTLKKVAAFSDIDATGGDGRYVVGVNPEKVYVGTTGGIKVLTVNNEDNTFTLAGSYIEGTSGGSQYAGQIGDMVCNGRYVFAVKQSTGVYVLDTETDQLIATIPESTAVALTRSFDGDIWCASTTKLYHIDTENLVFDQTYTFPSSFPQSWSAWRPSNLFASKNENVLYWGHSAGWNAGCDWIYRWEIGTEFPTQPIFNSPFPTYPGGKSANKAYAGGGYDSRTNTLLVASCSGAGTAARYNHLNFIDGTTGELLRSVEMKPYFWFPSHPLFPDKYAPEFSDDTDLLKVSAATASEYAMTDIVADKDHPSAWLSSKVAVADAMAYDGSDEVAQISAADGKITLTPQTAGLMTLEITAESNGKVASKSIPVQVGDINLIDAKPYAFSGNLEDVDVQYTRQFGHTQWQALYVPFAIRYEEWANVADVAEFVGVSNVDGVDMLEFRTITSGSLEPHTPYIIAPKAGGEMVLASSRTTLGAAPETDGSVSFTAGANIYTLTGIYQAQAIDGCYALKNGVFMKGESAGQLLNPNRIYLSITGNTPQKVGVRVDGQTTGIFDVTVEGVQADGYNVKGQRVSDDYKGLIIKKGQKTINK